MVDNVFSLTYDEFLVALNNGDLHKQYKLPICSVTTNDTHGDGSMWWHCVNLAKETSPSEISGHTAFPQLYPQFRKLNALLLRCGGSETCFPVYEEDMANILKRGYFYDGISKLMKGEDCHCHSNSANLWERNHKEHDIHICTGYALSRDGYWRQHSWLVHRYFNGRQKRTRVIETTVKRVAYFGFEMTEEEAELFAAENW